MIPKTAFKTWLTASEPLITLETLQKFITRLDRELLAKARKDYHQANVECLSSRAYYGAHRTTAQHELQVLVPALRKARGLVSRLKLKDFTMHPSTKLELHRHLLSYLTKTPQEAFDGPVDRARMFKVRMHFLSFNPTHQRTAFALLTDFPELFAPVPEVLATPDSQFKDRLFRKLRAVGGLTPEEGALLDRLFATKVL